MSVGFLLDTNVLSELMRTAPAPEVMVWFAGQGVDHLNTSVITQAKILAGIVLLSEGQRRDALAVAVHAICEEDFQGLCLILPAKPQRLTRWRERKDRVIGDLSMPQMPRSRYRLGSRTGLCEPKLKGV